MWKNIEKILKDVIEKGNHVAFSAVNVRIKKICVQVFTFYNLLSHFLLCSRKQKSK